MTTKPWHQICDLRDEVLKGTLSLSDFAADLYSVRTGTAPEVYGNADRFFSRTYPTHRMKELTRDVLQRLAGTGGSPVRRLQVAYGGGKTHTLITLLHLAERASEVADNPTVKEFVTFAGVNPVPSARVALLPFDKFDVHEGLEVIAPNGERRTVKTPWGALAYQLAGDAGFARVKAHEESFSTPAQPILEELLKAPNAEGKGALILLDEALIYCRAEVNLDGRRLGILQDFFQLLTQAVAATNRACIVATLLSSDALTNDATGLQVLQALEKVFVRLQETSEPVTREDIAEVLRRRLFERCPQPNERRPIIDAMLASFADCGKLREAQKNQAAYQRLLDSYPFHPDLLEVFYEKWTEFGDSFQRTRGSLRLLALALQQSAQKDPAVFVGLSTFLGPDKTLSPAVTELLRIATTGGSDQWTPKLNGELERAREIQAQLPSLKDREIEQAVLGTFLHSQPPGRRADNADLYVLLVHPEVDLAALETGLDGWRKLSWFLTEETNAWRLTTEPNLTHIHVQMMQGLGEEKINDALKTQVERVNELASVDKDGADRGVKVHRLPVGPSAIDDDTDLHYLILGPEYALDPAQTVPQQATAFFTTKMGPRTYTNTLVALAPDIARLAGLRRVVMELIGWQSLNDPKSDVYKGLTDAQKKTLAERRSKAEADIPGVVRAAYNVVLDMGEDGNVRAQMLKSPDSLGITDTRPFARIKAMLRTEERLIEGDLLPELLLRDSYYELWSPGDTHKHASDLLKSFAQFPRLPRFLSAQLFRNALARGCEDGAMVLRLPRPDNTARTFWRIRPSSEELGRTELEVWPASEATLVELDPALFAPTALPNLWPSASEPISLKDCTAYFIGGADQPKVPNDVMVAAIGKAVQLGFVMARTPSRSYFKELLPAESLTDSLELLSPPQPVRPEDISPQSLPAAWKDGETTVESLSDALAAERGGKTPWPLIYEAVSSALQKKQFRVKEGSIWPCPADQAEKVVLSVGGVPTPATTTPPPPRPNVLTTEATLTDFELIKLADAVQELKESAPSLTFEYHVTIVITGDGTDATTAAKLNKLLADASSKLNLS